MFNFIKNKFLFIIAISVLTLILLVVGAITLYKDESASFSDEGYIISTTTKKNAKFYFSANTKYKDNADNKVTFKNIKSKTVSVDPASFVHYNNGSILFLQKGALVNLNEINSPIVSYYNVTRNNIIKKDNNYYTVSSNGEDINLNSFIGRISDKKYIFAGNNLSLEIPSKNNKITGDYFEVTYIKDGIVKIDNKDVSYQVTAQNSFINVGNNIRINLGNEKIYYEGSAKMLLSQITINGDENINLDVNKENGSGAGGNGSGDGTETNTTSDSDENGAGGSGSGGDGTTNDTATNDSADQNKDAANTTEESKKDDGNNSGTENGGGSGSGGSGSNNNVKIELISADVTSTSINALFQLNNASLIKGNLIATLTNISNNEKEEPISIPATNGSFSVSKKALLPNTEYNLTITDNGKENGKQFFQKTFKTRDLGISIEKQFATDNSLSYNVLFDENSEVNKVKVVIYNNMGTNDEITPNEFIVSKNDISKNIEFNNLNSNSSYSISIDTIWIDNIAYEDLYTINRIDTTLKKTPIISDIQIKANTEEIKFNIKANSIEDPDEGIISYTYKVYKSDSINLEGTEPELVYSTTRNDPDAIDLDLTKIDTMKTGVNYRCKVFVQYNDNEMIRETESDYSGNFLIKSKPNISWQSTSTTADEIKGKLTLLDASCSIPIRGRSCLSQANNFTLRYYKISEGESNSKEMNINFNANSLIADIDINKGLSSSTAYAFKLYANYYDDNNILHTNVQIGDPFYVTTDESTKVKFKVKKDNESGKDPRGAEIVTFDASLVKPKDSNVDEETSSITLKLYSGSYNVPEKMIGTYTISEENLIEDFYNNFTITNTLFENETLGKLDSLQKMIRATNNQSGTLNRTYTVEISEIVSKNGSTDSIEIEDKVYTFKLTPSYYLDSRIASNPNYKYVNVTPIVKEDLTESEYAELSNTISNLDDLDNKTIVGVTIDNGLSDEYVDSAFTYEKVTVDYVVYNTTTNKESKRISINMDNKYQPRSQTIYLDPTELDDGEAFTRGYNYKIGYEIKFVTEDGSNPTYTNEKLYEKEEIPREEPNFKQYISTSTESNITYRYSITDIDSALNDKKLHYKIGNSNEYKKTDDNISVDGEYHSITIPMSERNKYTIYLNTKGTDGQKKYLEFSSSQFESVYNYDNKNLYTLVNDNDNTLKIKFINDDITNRTVAYKVSIRATDDNNIDSFERYFIASQLETETTNTSELDEEGNPKTLTTKYIAIDYAYLSRFLKHNIEVNVDAIYDSGLVGLNQSIENGFIFENITAKETEKYLNIYQGYRETTQETIILRPPTISKESINYGVYKNIGENSLETDRFNVYNNYNILMKNKNIEYIKTNGTTIVPNETKRDEYVVEFKVDYGKKGIILDQKYEGYNVKVLKTNRINSSNKTYRFNNIIPKVSLKTSTSTINSLKINVTSSGVYGQFIKDNNPHNKYYIDIYSDQGLTHKLTTLTSDATINENSITAEMVEYKNLKPATTYYATVSAYVDNRLTRLYDIDSKDEYKTKVYELKTLDASKLLTSLYYEVKPIDYEGESSRKRLEWITGLSNTENYKIRFELYDQEGNPKKFDGTDASSCNVNSMGTASNGFVNGCYIQVPKEIVNGNNSETGKKFSGNTNTYTFSGDNFVFGDGYYKLIIYAIPYTNGVYEENDKIVLYQAEELNNIKKGGIEIKIKPLKEPTFIFEQLISGVRCITEKDENGNIIKNEDNKYTCTNTNEDETYIDMKLSINDMCKSPVEKICSSDDDGNYVIKYGKFSIVLKDNENNVIATKNDLNVKALNKTYTFTGLTRNKRYNISVLYETYRNNVGLTEEEKIAIPQINNNILTPISKGIQPGKITAQQNGNNNKSIVLSYNGHNDIEKISKMKYRIKLNPGEENEKVEGEYILTGNEANNSFAVDNINKYTRKLIIDFSDNNNFTLQSGKSYIITTEYFYIDSDGIEKTIDDEFGLFDFDLNL